MDDLKRHYLLRLNKATLAIPLPFDADIPYEQYSQAEVEDRALPLFNEFAAFITQFKIEQIDQFPEEVIDQIHETYLRFND